MTSLSMRSPTTNLLSRLIEAPNLDRIVQQLPNERFTALVREIGVEDAGELVALATTEQLVAAFDEDLFVNHRPGERETFDRRRFVTWLEVLLEAGDRAIAGRVAELSEDFVAHALSSLVLVFDHDQLRERITEDDPAAAEADGALERALNEEIDGYLLVAREEDGWDAVLALVLALDRSHRSLLVRILDRCAALASGYVDDLDALAEVLSEAQTLAEDVEAAREERRSQLGYVEPRAAKGFLALARMPMEGELEGQSRDATTRAYFRELDRKGRDLDRKGRDLDPSRHARGRGVGHGGGRRALGEASSTALEPANEPLRQLLAELPSPSTADGTIEDQAPRLALAWRALSDQAPPRFQERLAELAYLSNVVLAGVADEDGLRLRPGEAAQAALATVALGAELQARGRRSAGPSSSPRATPDQLREVLEAHPADLLFRKACSTLIGRGVGRPSGVVRSRAELEQALEALDAPSQPPERGAQ